MVAFGALVVALLAAMLLVASSPATAAGDPVVVCAWALGDANNDPLDGVQYGPDAAPATVADAGGTPCTYDLGLGSVVMAPDATDIVDVVPAASGTATGVELWAAVGHPDGLITAAADLSVRWTLSGPDGSSAEVTSFVAGCHGELAPGPAWDWASTNEGATGTMSASSIVNADGNGMWEQCRQGQLDVVRGVWEFTGDTACGRWEVNIEVFAYDSATETSQHLNVLCVVALDIDAADLAWGSIARSVESRIDGDADPATLDAPTVTNGGNVAVEVGIVFGPMTSLETEDAIDNFAAVLTLPDGTIVERNPVAADEQAWFTVEEPPAAEGGEGEDPGEGEDGGAEGEGQAVASPGALCRGESAALDLVVLPDPTLSDGIYAGSITVVARVAAPCEEILE